MQIFRALILIRFLVDVSFVLAATGQFVTIECAVDARRAGQTTVATSAVLGTLRDTAKRFGSRFAHVGHGLAGFPAGPGWHRPLLINEQLTVRLFIGPE